MDIDTGNDMETTEIVKTMETSPFTPINPPVHETNIYVFSDHLEIPGQQLVCYLLAANEI